MAFALPTGETSQGLMPPERLPKASKGAHILTGGKEACEGGKTKPIGVSRKPKQSELPDDLVVTIGRQFQEASQARTEEKATLSG